MSERAAQAAQGGAPHTATAVPAWQRWHVQRVAPVPSALRVAHAHTPPGTQTSEREAFEQGRAQGQREAQAGAWAQGMAQGREDGYAEGMAAGVLQGREQALAELRAQAQDTATAELHTRAAEWLALTRSMPQALAQAEETLAQDLSDLALSIARQIVGQALSVDPGLMLGMVRELLQAEPALTGAPQLLLHPQDLALVREHLHEEVQSAGWRLKADAALERGGCRVLAASGELDARLSTRWQRVSAALNCQPVVAHVEQRQAA
jgi:flagellar assembly protein FliH